MVSSTRRLACLTLLVSVTLGAQPGPLRSAQAKIGRIENGRAAPGSTIRFSEDELIAYAMAEAEVIAPGAVQSPTLQLSAGHAEATASINFLKVSGAKGESLGWMMRQLLDGERPVSIAVRIESRAGEARVDVDRVTVSGVPIEGDTLNFLIRHFVVPNFPDARVGQWFPLGNRMEGIEIGDGFAQVGMRR